MRSNIGNCRLQNIIPTRPLKQDTHANNSQQRSAALNYTGHPETSIYTHIVN